MLATADFRLRPQRGVWHYNHVTFTPIAKNFILYCRLIYMLSILCVRPTIKVKVGIPESFKVGWYPPPQKKKNRGRVTLRCRALKDPLETLNTRKSASRRILSGILLKNSENVELKPKFKPLNLTEQSVEFSIRYFFYPWYYYVISKGKGSY